MILKIHINYKYVTSGHGNKFYIFLKKKTNSTFQCPSIFNTILYRFCYFSEMLTCVLKTYVNEYNVDIFF